MDEESLRAQEAQWIISLCYFLASSTHLLLPSLRLPQSSSSRDRSCQSPPLPISPLPWKSFYPPQNLQAAAFFLVNVVEPALSQAYLRIQQIHSPDHLPANIPIRQSNCTNDLKNEKFILEGIIYLNFITFTIFHQLLFVLQSRY